VANARLGATASSQAAVADKALLAEKRQAVKDAVAALGKGWKGGGSSRISMNINGGEVIAQTDADASVAIDGDMVRYRRASARFKHGIPIDCDHVIVMRIQGTACQVGLCGEMYDPERDGATNAHTLGVYLDTGTCVINSEMVLDSKRYFHHKLLASFLPYGKLLRDKDKALQDHAKEAAYRIKQHAKADGQNMVVEEELSRADLRARRYAAAQAKEDTTPQEGADAKPLDSIEMEKVAAKARKEELRRLAKEKLKKRQRSGMTAPRINRAQLSAFTGRNNVSESSNLDPRFDMVGLDANDGIRREHGPKDVSWNHEMWVIMKIEPAPAIMFDEHGLGHWHFLSNKNVPYRNVGYGGTGFQYYPFVELFDGAKVLETMILSTGQFDKRKHAGAEMIRAAKMAENVAITENDMKAAYKAEPRNTGSGVSASLLDKLMKQRRTPTPSSLVRPDSW